MSWTPKPGDRVTSPLLVGEWEVVRSDAVIVWLAHSNGAAVSINREHVSPVAPPLPAEPPVGSVVWARGQLWLRTDENGPWHWATAKNLETWEFLAAASDLSPVVAVSQVADWWKAELAARQPEGVNWIHGLYDEGSIERFVERFGWPDE